MSDRKPLSDAEIADLSEDAPPIHPVEPMRDFESVMQERFLNSVEGWLIKKVSLEEVRAEILTQETIPSFRSEFETFVSAATNSHELWEFCSPKSDWNRLAGRSGFALVIEGTVTHAIVTLVS